MSTVVVDVETTTFLKGNPFSARNRCCYVGAYIEGQTILTWSDDLLYNIRPILADTTTLVGFNTKFDIHHLRRLGYRDLDFRIWDCQLAHFLQSGQVGAYPSLNDTASFWGIEGKDDRVEREYWSAGIDTPDIPRDILIKYLEQDLRVTWQVYEKQLEYFLSNPQLYRLFVLQCEDQKSLIEMEENGLLLDTDKASEKARSLYEEISAIERDLSAYYRGIPINWDSHDHCSTILYGGTIEVDIREAVGVYKTGAKVGQPRYRIAKQVYNLPRLFEPLPNTELKKEGYWSTDESILRQLKGNVPKMLNKRSELSKLLDYYEGYPNLLTKMDWPDKILHGQLNQCVARTGRLSASNPNQQNIAEEAKEIIISRYACSS